MASPAKFSSSFFFTLLLYFLSVTSLPPLTSSAITVPLSLSHFNPNPSPDTFQKLNHIASVSLSRAKHIKNPPSLSQITTKEPLFSHSYGGYSISLSVGTPPQTIPFLLDTGSDLVWFPCTHRYLCKNCSLPSNPTNIPSFIPKLSSSSKLLGCVNPKCGWIHDPDVQSRCRDCESDFKNCSQICPPYMILYGSGTTGGIALEETLDLPNLKVPDFVVGCSLFSSRQPAGIAGFGRGSASLPSQLGLSKFSYCLLSRKFDDSEMSSDLILDMGSTSDKKTEGLSYTPLLRNPFAGKSEFSVYYYIGLRRISVGGKKVKVPYKYLYPASDGNGGTIIDSGTTFTYMVGEVFDLVANEFVNQVKNYERAINVERITGLRPCFNISSGSETVSFPELKFQFKGGAELALPLANYFSIIDDAVCLTMVTDGVLGDGSDGGPSIILGNFQQQNFYMEFNLRNERLGFRHQSCNS
ncbi:Xylanase inhibitor, C-terminal [Dillenia turbinata]|uniref:Xylanase inhibitor, C-terminal n=1 Tax=Dillenia turbinata TaxID=194707 RepID=A0AAN8VJK7_9MAGN